MDAFIRKIMEEQGAVGIAAAAVNKDGQVLYQKFFGYRDRERQMEINEDTIFGLASITKSFTTLAILQMEEQGILKLDDPVSDYIPEFTACNQSKPVLIRHFLSHAGGYFPLHRTTIAEVVEKLGIREAEEGDLAYSEKLASGGCRLVAEQMDAQTRLLCQPGERMSYCNDGFGLLSEIIRRYGGETSFPEYLKEHILNPLGMARSTADFLTPAADENAAVLYSEEDGIQYADHDYHRMAFVLGGGGAMKSTLKDMQNYVTMYLNGGILGGVQILRESQIREMTLPRQSNLPGSWYGYGLASRTLRGREFWGHGGSLPGVSSNFAFSRELGIGVIVLCNTENVSVQPIADAILRHAMGDCDPTRDDRSEYTEYPWTLQEKQQVSGNYRMEEGESFQLLLSENDRLTLVQNGNERQILTIAPGLILVRGKYSDNYIEIVRDNDHNVYAARYGSRVYPRE